MFFIVNTTKKRITLNDLKLTLGPRQAVDLDRLVDRDKAEKSAHLRAAKANGDIEIRIKDDLAGAKAKEPAPAPRQNEDLSKIKDDIINELSATIKGLSKQISEGAQGSNSSLSESDLDKIAQRVIQSLPEKQVVVQQSGPTEETVDISDDLLREINTRAVNKMVKDTSASGVRYQEGTSKDDIKGNVDELSDLLG
jgi:hypothetical protein